MRENGIVIYNKKAAFTIKILICLFIFSVVARNLRENGMFSYCEYKDYDIQNDVSSNSIETIAVNQGISQDFISKGNILSNIKIYFADLPESNVALSVSIKNKKDKVLFTREVNVSQFQENVWNKIDISCSKLKRGKTYSLIFHSENRELLMCLGDSSDNTDVYKTCSVAGTTVDETLAVGFQFTYRYFTFANTFMLIANFCGIILSLVALLFAILRFEYLYEILKRSEKKHGISYAIYFSTLFTFLFNPMNQMHTQISKFKRIIGAGVIGNYDCSKVIFNFAQWFACFVICFYLFLLVSHYILIKDRSKEQEKIIKYLNNIIILANTSLLLKAFAYFYDESMSESVFNYTMPFLTLFILILASYLILQLDKRITADEFMRLLLCGYAASYAVSLLLPTEWQNGKLLFAVQVLILCLPVFVLCIFRTIRIIGSFLSGSVIILSMIPFGTSLYIEAINILNQHGIFVAHPRKYYGVLFLLALISCVILSYIFHRGKYNVDRWKSWAYPCLVLGITCMSAQLPLESVYNANIFEGANAGVLIGDFLKFGSLPIVEHYGGHMMTGVWEGILYALLNNDPAGAVFTPYGRYLVTVYAVLLFYLIKYIWDEDIAIWVVLLFPFSSIWNYFALGMLACMTVLSYVRKSTYQRAFLVWISIAWCALYRLDLGVAFGIASILTLIIYVIVNPKKKMPEQLLLTFFIVVSAGGVLWCVLCLWKGINPFSRLKEFVVASASNLNWAYGQIGDPSYAVYSWVYFFVPSFVETSLIYVIVSKSFRKRCGDSRWIILLLFGIAYVANQSRGMVRHSLAEGRTVIALWSAYFYIAILASCIKRKKIFLPILTLLLLANTSLLNRANFVDTHTVDNVLSKMESVSESWGVSRFAQEEMPEGKTAKSYWEQLSEKKQVATRVQWDDSLTRQIRPYQGITNILLDTDETFLDFMNRSFVYPALGKKNPVYVSQSPMQLSGEYAQEQFINEIQKNIEDVPIAIMPNTDIMASASLDGIPNVYRYYKVAEFVYIHYVPLCNLEEVVVWCLRDRYEDMKKKLDSTTKEKEIKNLLEECNNIKTHNCNLKVDQKNQSIILETTGADPRISGLQRLIELSDYVDSEMKIIVDYESDKKGTMQMFYTSKRGEEYTEDKMINASIRKSGKAIFIVPVTEYSKLRLDIPEESTVTIKSLKISGGISLVDWGYDGRMESIENGIFHNYNLAQLPLLWAEKDDKKARNNTITTEMNCQGDVYLMNNPQDRICSNGNYLLLTASYTGMDQEGLSQGEDEYDSAVIKLGKYEKGEFKEKYRYIFTMQEGIHSYLFRVSSDYYWRVDDINAVRLECTSNNVYDVNMKILEGD